MAGHPVYVPKDRDSLPEGLRQGSAIMRVGRVLRVASRVSAQESFGDVCRRVAQQGDPLDPKSVELIEIGFFDEFEGAVRLRPVGDKLLAAWTGQVPYRNDLEASDSRHRERQQARTDLRRAYTQGNMAKVERIMRRHNIRHW